LEREGIFLIASKTSRKSWRGKKGIYCTNSDPLPNRFVNFITTASSFKVSLMNRCRNAEAAMSFFSS
jgi:hypothetical protein